MYWILGFCGSKTQFFTVVLMPAAELWKQQTCAQQLLTNLEPKGDSFRFQIPPVRIVLALPFASVQFDSWTPQPRKFGLCCSLPLEGTPFFPLKDLMPHSPWHHLAKQFSSLMVSRPYALKNDWESKLTFVYMDYSYSYLLYKKLKQIILKYGSIDFK